MISVNRKRIKDPELIAKGLRLHQAGDLAQAMDVYADILRRHPKHAVALYLMGLLFEAVNEPHRAWTLLNEACRIKPGFVEAWYNRGVVEQWLGRIPDAQASYERALQLNPRFAAAYVNLGNVLMAAGDHDGAIRAYDQATALHPNTVEGRNNRGFVHLVRGQWAEGWEDYELRWALPGHVAANPMPSEIPWWNGEPLEGKRITLVHEQGVGDTLMMLRYVAGLRFMGAKVTLRVPASLARLCRVSYPDCTVQGDALIGQYARGNEVPWLPADYLLPMMSLPHRFGTRVDTVPMRATPYLRAPAEGPRVEAPPGFRVAFAWKGSKDHKNDRNRSTPLSAWAPLLGVPGVSWVCLQQEMTEPERLVVAKLPNVTLVDGLTDWADTAHVLSQVDALVACDTGMTHLAGAMGVTTCVLISGLPDFRHLLDRFESPWYQSTALFRQPRLGDWATPIGQIAARLRAIVQDHERRRAA